MQQAFIIDGPVTAISASNPASNVDILVHTQAN
jgi:hypothetical protein